MPLSQLNTNSFGPLAITTSQIANNAVTTLQIANNAVTNVQVANNTIGSSQLATGSVEGYIQNTSSSFGFRNILHNGAMQIDQHNAGANTSATYGSVSNYGLDRWQVNNYNGTTSNSIYFQQVADAPPGFYQSLKVQCTNGVATSSNSVGRRNTGQYIEGNNIHHLNWGTANAKAVTLSFWAKSSLTGTFAVSLEEVNTISASYVTTFNITQANTWQYFVINIPGPTIGSWVTSSAGALDVLFDLGQGSAISATSASQLNSWQAADLRGYTGAVHIGDTTGATFQYTGVQLELGNQATPYEHRPFGIELAICQRYFETSFSYGTAPQSGLAQGNGQHMVMTAYTSSAGWVIGIKYSVPKRAQPVVTYYGNNSTGSGSLWGWYTTGWNTFTGMSVDYNNVNAFGAQGSSSGSFSSGTTYLCDGSWTSSAEL